MRAITNSIKYRYLYYQIKRYANVNFTEEYYQLLCYSHDPDGGYHVETYKRYLKIKWEYEHTFRD